MSAQRRGKAEKLFKHIDEMGSERCLAREEDGRWLEQQMVPINRWAASDKIPDDV